MAQQNAISPTRAEDFPEWYQQVIKAADLAENSEVRGCMVIKPWGYAIWELIQQQMDAEFKRTGHTNAYFPMLIPVSYLEKEAEHAEGFATECAVVTHHRLEAVKDPETGKTKMIPSGELTDKYVIRPTSETVIGAAFSRWLESYRDLPFKVNQWCNVMRWEMRPRIFLRTAEFLWQEGHTMHATAEEAREETIQMLNVYADFHINDLAIPVIKGVKTPSDKFAGAEDTYAIEALMHDGKSLQAATSHFFGDGFAKAFDIQYTDKDNTLKYVHQTSWGLSTRTIGAIIMVHGDDSGLKLPPRVAPTQVMIIPIQQKKEGVLDKAYELRDRLAKGFRVKVDDTDKSPGWKFSEAEMRGYPLRLEGYRGR